ncbi:MAG: PIN domain-containing protein [Verrucomicrobia bacterium]|jgi:uncharacterized protein|nr:PIN domain-containing protein [Verrucomicrobiota bacterium]
MQKFLDVNVWLPILWPKHTASQTAQEWLSREKEMLVICRVVQLALLRHLTNSAILGEDVLSNANASKLLQDILNAGNCQFAEEPLELTSMFPKAGESTNSRRNVWTDAYLAAFAITGNYELVTFDRDFSRYRKMGLQMQLLKTQL